MGECSGEGLQIGQIDVRCVALRCVPASRHMRGEKRREGEKGRERKKKKKKRTDRWMRINLGWMYVCWRRKKIIQRVVALREKGIDVSCESKKRNEFLMDG